VLVKKIFDELLHFQISCWVERKLGVWSEHLTDFGIALSASTCGE
jgi:hypothetical protein